MPFKSRKGGFTERLGLWERGETPAEWEKSKVNFFLLAEQEENRSGAAASERFAFRWLRLWRSYRTDSQRTVGFVQSCAEKPQT